MKSLFRCTIFMVEDKYKGTRPSNIFERADSKEIAAQAAAQMFDKQLRANGFGEVKVRVDVYPSSEEEVDLYKRGMEMGHNTQGSLN